MLFASTRLWNCRLLLIAEYSRKVWTALSLLSSQTRPFVCLCLITPTCYIRTGSPSMITSYVFFSLLKTLSGLLFTDRTFFSVGYTLFENAFESWFFFVAPNIPTIYCCGPFFILECISCYWSQETLYSSFNPAVFSVIIILINCSVPLS
jgi:hypothetical protein